MMIMMMIMMVMMMIITVVQCQLINVVGNYHDFRGFGNVGDNFNDELDEVVRIEDPSKVIGCIIIMMMTGEG